MRIVALAMVALGAALTIIAADAPPPTGAKKSKEDKALMQIDQIVEKSAVDKSKANWRTTLKKPEVAAFEPGRSYFVRMQTSKGPLKIKLMPDVAPMHVTSFLYLTKLGYYDGLSFHRVIPGFMAQGGCPLGNGTGGPGYTFGGEFKPEVKHDRGGLLSMANAGPGTDGSQFFLTFVATPWLDNKHTIFGEVVEGKETLKALEAVGSSSGKTSEPLKIEKAVVDVG
jgi:cyclophilin family peptidyl-prolyl cis-trans isomerase